VLTGHACSYSGATLEIRVEGQVYHIPKSIICRTSELFKKAAKPEWAGEHGKPVLLEEETARVFRLYTIWLYNGTIDRAEADLKTWKPLTEAYIMGEKFMDSAFQAVILQNMIHRLASGRQPDINTMNEIYHGTVDNSPARCLMIDICIWEKRDCLRHVENPVAELHEDLVNDLLKALMSTPKLGKSPWATDVQKYYGILLNPPTHNLKTGDRLPPKLWTSEEYWKSCGLRTHSSWITTSYV
jgi:hypothetical protein